MSSPVDVLAVMDATIKIAQEGYIPEHHEVVALEQTRAAIAELIEAAGDYFARYCQDEAADDGVDFTGCTQEQHLDAIRLRAAIARATGEGVV